MKPLYNDYKRSLVPGRIDDLRSLIKDQLNMAGSIEKSSPNDIMAKTLRGLAIMYKVEADALSGNFHTSPVDNSPKQK